MLLINENDMRWQDAAMANLQLKNILTNYHIGEGNVNCGVSRWPHGEAGKPHTHDAQDEIYIVLRGQGKARLGEETKVLGPGDIMHARAGEVHGMVEGISENGIEMFCILIPTEKK